MKALITGGAGFIGCNAVKRYLEAGHEVVVIDDLSRKGSEKNLAWLQEQKLGKLTFHKVDIRDARAVDGVFREHKGLGTVLHLAAQVAVTTSVTDPRHDFEVNALGTFNVLEGVRAHHKDVPFIYSSTNKVYGGLEHLTVVEKNGQYGYANHPNGVSESESLDFHSPYGCSKGAADQYVHDYARIYGLRTVCFRQSCIYGTRQFGVEDQGWVAWFTIQTTKDRPITIYGDGKQVRDVLFVDDLVDLFFQVAEKIDLAKGQAYNIGGGPSNVLSLHGLIDRLERFAGKKIERKYDAWRPGDQRVFVCDIAKIERDIGWKPKIGVDAGVEKLHAWVSANAGLFT